MGAMRFAAPVPILRMFDLEKAKDFYVGFLGFAVDWEHRFEPDLPVYMQVSRGDCRIHLSEHHGDGTPGTAIRVEMPDSAGACEHWSVSVRTSRSSQIAAGKLASSSEHSSANLRTLRVRARSRPRSSSRRARLLP